MLYSVRADGKSKTVELDIYDMVGQSGFFYEAVSAKDVRSTLAQHPDASNIIVRINSKGGSVTDGMAIYNLLAGHKAKVRVEIDGLAASVASVVAMAGDEIHMGAGSWLMMHDAWATTTGNAKELRQAADTLEKMSEQAAEIYSARSGLSKQYVLGLMAKTSWLSAADAKRKGFADSVQAAKAKAENIKAFAAVRQEDLDSWANVPDEFRSAVLCTEEPNFEPVAKDATLDTEDLISVEIDESMTPDELKAALTEALAPIQLEFANFKTQIDAQASVPQAQSQEPAPAFAARVNSACERYISGNKLHNTPAARAFFVGQAKDEDGLKALCSYYDEALPIVATEKVVLGSGVPGPTKRKPTPEQAKLCATNGWDFNELYADEQDSVNA